MSQAKYKRIILKLSGESFSPSGERGISMEEVVHISQQIFDAQQLGCEIAVVIGGGNILRGSQFTQKNKIVHEATAHYMGMMATIINGMALQSALEKVGVYTRLISAIEVNKIAEPYIRRRAVRHLEKGRVVIFGAGTGNPYFTTDSAASLRAIEIDADIILKGTRVDGIYNVDPEKDPNAVKFETITFSEVLTKELKVMDLTAFTLCKENDLPIVVFDMDTPGTLKKVVMGEGVGTLVH